MINWNGFYNLREIEKDKETLLQFFREALSLSNGDSHVDRLEGVRRVNHESLTPEEYIEKYISPATHNVAINRWEYNHRADWAEKRAEIGSSTLAGQSLYLFIYLDLESLEVLVEKYKLEKL